MEIKLNYLKITRRFDIFPYSDRSSVTNPAKEHVPKVVVSKFKWIKIVPLQWILQYQFLASNHFTFMHVDSRSITGNYLQIRGEVSLGMSQDRPERVDERPNVREK